MITTVRALGIFSLYASIFLAICTEKAQATLPGTDKLWEKKLSSCLKSSTRGSVSFSEFKSRAQFASFARSVESYTYISSTGRMYGMTALNGSAMKCFSDGYINKIENYCAAESPAYQGVCRGRTFISGNQLLGIDCSLQGAIIPENPACTVRVKGTRIR